MMDRVYEIEISTAQKYYYHIYPHHPIRKPVIKQFLSVLEQVVRPTGFRSLPNPLVPI